MMMNKLKLWACTIMISAILVCQGGYLFNLAAASGVTRAYGAALPATPGQLSGKGTAATAGQLARNGGEATGSSLRNRFSDPEDPSEVWLELDVPQQNNILNSRLMARATASQLKQTLQAPLKAPAADDRCIVIAGSDFQNPSGNEEGESEKTLLKYLQIPRTVFFSSVIIPMHTALAEKRQRREWRLSCRQ